MAGWSSLQIMGNRPVHRMGLTAALAAREGRLLLGEYGAHRIPGVLGAGDARHGPRFVFELPFETFCWTGKKKVFRFPESARRALRESARKCPGLGVQRLSLDDTVDQASDCRFFGGQRFVEHVELRRAARPHPARQEIAAAAIADNSDPGEGGVEFCARR